MKQTTSIKVGKDSLQRASRDLLAMKFNLIDSACVELLCLAQRPRPPIPVLLGSIACCKHRCLRMGHINSVVENPALRRVPNVLFANEMRNGANATAYAGVHGNSFAVVVVEVRKRTEGARWQSGRAVSWPGKASGGRRINGAMSQLNLAPQQNASVSEALTTTVDRMGGQAAQIQELGAFSGWPVERLARRPSGL